MTAHDVKGSVTGHIVESCHTIRCWVGESSGKSYEYRNCGYRCLRIKDNMRLFGVSCFCYERKEDGKENQRRKERKNKEENAAAVIDHTLLITHIKAHTI